MSYEAFMKQATDIVAERGKNYGDVSKFLDRFTQMYELCTGIRLTNREAAMFMHVWKLTRVFENPENADHYMDGVNYLAFAGVANETAQKEAAANQPPIPYAPTMLKPLNLSERAVAKALASDTGA